MSSTPGMLCSYGEWVHKVTEHDKEVESMENFNAKKIMLKQPNVCS